MGELQGADKLQQHLTSLSLDNGRLQQILDRACIIVENQAKINCPVKYGTLRASITHEVEGVNGVVGTNTEYAPYVEFGTGLFAEAGNGRQTPWSYQDENGEWHTTIGQHPQPYLGLALNQQSKAVQDYIAREISNVK